MLTKWILTAVAGVSVCLLGPDAHGATTAVAGEDFPRALLGLATLAQLAIAIWVLTIVIGSAIFGPSHLFRAITPRLLRGVLIAGATGAFVIGPAQADRQVTTPHSLSGLPLPDRPTVTAHPDHVLVRPGDTLWAIARRSLPQGATDAEIAESCHDWYAHNRDVIGDDPNLIFPAQRLTPPAKERP